MRRQDCGLLCPDQKRHNGAHEVRRKSRPRLWHLVCEGHLAVVGVVVIVDVLVGRALHHVDVSGGDGGRLLGRIAALVFFGHDARQQRDRMAQGVSVNGIKRANATSCFCCAAARWELQRQAVTICM